MKTIDKIPTSKIQRASKLFQTGAKVGVNYLKYYGDKIITSEMDAKVRLNQNNADDILYNLDGGGNSTYNWTGSLAAGAITSVSLGVMSPSAGAHTLNVSTNLPNGSTDVNTGNDGNSSAFTMVIGGEVITLTIDTDCYGEETYWELKDASTTNGKIYTYPTSLAVPIVFGKKNTIDKISNLPEFEFT